MRDIIDLRSAIDLGVVAATKKPRENHWDNLNHYANAINLDPSLQSYHLTIRDMCLAAFTDRVRTGSYSMGHQIKVQGVTQALADIGKTVEMDFLPNPIYCAPPKYHLQIERCVEGMRRKDPLAFPQLALPGIVPEEMARSDYADHFPKERAICDFSVITFYHLL